MELHFLGTSGHGITPIRQLPAALIDGHILLDCGEGTVKTLLELHIPIPQIKVILLSHLHADHFLGIVSLLWQLAFYSYDLSPKPSSPLILLPAWMKTVLEQILETSASPFDKVGFHPRIQELEGSDYELTLPDTQLRYHLRWCVSLHNPICYSYRFNDNVVFSGGLS